MYLQVEKLMYMEPRKKKTRELKNKIRSSLNSVLQHAAFCCSQITFKV